MEKGTERTKRIALIASKGTLDMAYPPLILAVTAASMDMEAGIFFTFYGMDIINRRKYANLKVPPLANPAMPVPMPNILGVLPGMTFMATEMMKSWMGKAKIPPVPEMIKTCLDSGVKLYACSTTMGVMGVSKEDLIDGVEIAGAAAFLDFACDANISLFI